MGLVPLEPVITVAIRSLPRLMVGSVAACILLACQEERGDARRGHGSSLGCGDTDVRAEGAATNLPADSVCALARRAVQLWRDSAEQALGRFAPPVAAGPVVVSSLGLGETRLMPDRRHPTGLALSLPDSFWVVALDLAGDSQRIGIVGFPRGPGAARIGMAPKERARMREQ
jgi:hypothetical protein